MKFQRFFMFFMFLGTLLFSSCLPKFSAPGDVIDEDIPTGFEKLKVSQNFGFNALQQVVLNVKVNNPSFSTERYRINVYNAFPTFGSLVCTGITDQSQNVVLRFSVAATVPELYVERINSSGITAVTKIKTEDYISLNFGTSTPLLNLKKSFSGLDCAIGCDEKYEFVTSNTQQTIVVDEGKTICITDVFGVNLNIKNGTVRICSRAENIRVELMEASSKIIFMEGSKVTIDTIVAPNFNGEIINYSDSMVLLRDSLIAPNITNYGNIFFEYYAGITVRSASFVNYGSVSFRSPLQLHGQFINYKTVTSYATTSLVSGSLFDNWCQTEMLADFVVNGNVKNRQYFKVIGKLEIKKSASFTNSEAAILKATSCTLDGTLNSEGSVNSVVEVQGNSTFNSGAAFTGKLTYCDRSGIDANFANIDLSYFTCESEFIPANACKKESFGIGKFVDTDNDGVADVIDDFPTLNSRSHRSFYPSPSDFAFVAFDDEWPKAGDYDYNDLIVGYQYNMIHNTAGQVHQMEINVFIEALGSTKEHYFGFYLQAVNASEIRSVKGNRLSTGKITNAANGAESAENRAVVFVFDKPSDVIKRDADGYANVTPGLVSVSDTLKIVIEFNLPVDLNKLQPNRINPFICINGNRGNELHLADRPPTSKANITLFGTEQDASNAGANKYYRTKDNLAWAISFAEKPAYMIETGGKSVADAFKFFVSWAAKEGKEFKDWYEAKPGFQDESLIFQR